MNRRPSPPQRCRPRRLGHRPGGDGVEPVFDAGQQANLVKRGSDELDGVAMIFGLHVGPGVEAVETGPDRQAGYVEGRELVPFLRRLGTADPPDERRANVELGQCAHREHLVAKVGQNSAERTKVSRRSLEALR